MTSTSLVPITHTVEVGKACLQSLQPRQLLTVELGWLHNLT